MTTLIFLTLFFIFLIAVIGYFPDADPANSVLVSCLSYLIGNMKAWNWLLPINELLVCVGIIVAYEIIIWTWFHVLAPITKIIRGTTH